MTSTQPPSYDGHKPRRDSQSILSTVLSISVTSSRNSRAHSCVCPRLFRSSSAWTHPARHQVCGHAYTCGNQAAPRIAHRLEQPAVVLVPGQRRLCASGQRLQRNRGCICLVQYQHVVRSLLRHCICGHVCGVLIPCISCSNLMSIPEDLREVLETCLLKTHPQTTWLYIYQRCARLSSICSMAAVASSPCTVASCPNINTTSAPPTPARTPILAVGQNILSARRGAAPQIPFVSRCHCRRRERETRGPEEGQQYNSENESIRTNIDETFRNTVSPNASPIQRTRR